MYNPSFPVLLPYQIDAHTKINEIFTQIIMIHTQRDSLIIILCHSFANFIYGIRFWLYFHHIVVKAIDCSQRKSQFQHAQASILYCIIKRMAFLSTLLLSCVYCYSCLNFQNRLS